MILFTLIDLFKLIASHAVCIISTIIFNVNPISVQNPDSADTEVLTSKIAFRILSDELNACRIYLRSYRKAVCYLRYIYISRSSNCILLTFILRIQQSARVLMQGLKSTYEYMSFLAGEHLEPVYFLAIEFLSHRKCQNTEIVARRACHILSFDNVGCIL